MNASDAPRLDVVLTPRALREDDLDGAAVVVIDVLRASSTIVTALAHGARTVIPAADLGEAGRLRATLDPSSSVVGGERSGIPIAGFDAGNSPLEYSAEAVNGKTVVLTTSNGTGAIRQARSALQVAAGSFLNAERATRFLAEALSDGHRAVLLCAGSDGRTALEDTLCAGLLLDRLMTRHRHAAPRHAAPREEARALTHLPDAAQMAMALYRGSRASLARTLLGARHTQRLIALGYGDDVSACARIDAHDVLPILRDGRLVHAVAE